MAEFSVNDMLSSFNKREVARPYTFDVQFFIEPRSSIESVIDVAGLTLRCESAEMPGKTFMTTEQKIYGFTEKYPFETSFNDAQFIFILTDDFREKIMFDNWMNRISSPNSYHMNYKESYSCNINVNQYNVKGQRVYSATLEKAFPIVVNQLDLDWGVEGYQRLAVVFAYSYWKQTYPTSSSENRRRVQEELSE